MEINLTRLERETVITFNEAEQDAELYTASPVMMRKMEKLMAQSSEFKVLREDELSKTYIFPKKRVSIRKPIKKQGYEAVILETEE